MNNFKIAEKKSKKGNRVISIHQINKVDGECSHFCGWVIPTNKYKTLFPKRMILSLYKKVKPHYDLTIEEAFNIAFEKQDWEILPYNPLGATQHLEGEFIEEYPYLKLKS